MELATAGPGPEFYRMVLEQLGTFAILDRGGRYVYVSETWAKNRGCAVSDAIGRHVLEYFPDTRALEAMDSGQPILAHPIMINEKSKRTQYTSYLPVHNQERVEGCIIQTIFHDASEAMQFYEQFDKLRNERNYYRQELQRLRGTRYSLDNIVGTSAPVMRVKRQIHQAARSVSHVLIEGDTGTGKELVAHAIHHLSPRSAHPFIKVNCAAIPLELAESELFGYEHGAFTGARSGGKAGKFELADKGSLFLDEINQLSPVIQPKLLRVLQEKEVERIGGTRSATVDVRLIAATNASLEQLIEKKLFRSDLYYRLNVVSIRVPPLRTPGRSSAADRAYHQAFERPTRHERGRRGHGSVGTFSDAQLAGQHPRAAERAGTGHE